MSIDRRSFLTGTYGEKKTGNKERIKESIKGKKKRERKEEETDERKKEQGKKEIRTKRKQGGQTD